MNMKICSVPPAAEFPDSYTADFTSLHWPAHIAMTSWRSLLTLVCFSMFTVRTNEATVAGVCIAWTGPPCDGNSNLMMAVIAAAAAMTTPSRASQSRWSLLRPRRRPVRRLGADRELEGS
jgi:hypothetical protein